MAIGALGALTIPTAIGVLPALIGGGALSVILSNMGFRVPAVVVPKVAAGEIDVEKAFAEGHSEVELHVPPDQRAAAHAFLNRTHAAHKAIEAVKAILAA